MANQKDGGNLSPVDVLKETEDYVQGSDLVSLFRGMAIETFKARPEKPATFLIDYLSRLYPSSAESVFSRMGRTSEGGVTSSSGCPAVTVYHGDAREHDYLVNKVPPPIVGGGLNRAVR